MPHDAPATQFEDLKAAPYNPRKVTAARRKMLKQALEAFGDLGGIVFNTTTGHLVGGHARVDALKKLENPTLRITRALSEPSKNGTVAEGYIQAGKERFTYREVAWSPDKERMANVAANKQAGTFVSAMLAETLQEMGKVGADLSLTMFDPDELRGLLPSQDDAKGLAASVNPHEDAHRPAPERVHGATPPEDAAHADALEAPAMQQVTLTFRAPEMAKFKQLVDALKDIYHVSNVSDVVLEAIKRASVQAAFAHQPMQ